MEIFVYQHVRGTDAKASVSEIEDGLDVGSAIAGFDAGQANCFLQADRHHLLSLIETAFGDLRPFNTMARHFLEQKIRSSLRVLKSYKHLPSVQSATQLWSEPDEMCA